MAHSSVLSKVVSGVSAAQALIALRPLVGEARADKLDRVAAGRLSGLAVVVENLFDPHNGGAALRSCEAVGVHEVHFVGDKVPRFSARVTQGCEKWLELHHDATVAAAVESLKARGFRTYATVPGAAVSLEEVDATVPAAFLIGNEHTGLTDEARRACDLELAIPLDGFSQSLNLSVATALTVYTHAQRRRRALGRRGDLSGVALDELRLRYYRREVRGADAVISRWLRENSANG